VEKRGRIPPCLLRGIPRRLDKKNPMAILYLYYLHEGALRCTIPYIEGKRENV
jgi:hypothetical protein